MITTQFRILQMLMDNLTGLYGGELLELSAGNIKETTLYVTLQRMRDSGLVNTKLVPQADPEALPRRQYTISALGQARYNEAFAQIKSFTQPAVGQGI
jgi:DNA-binding PadR family transcriptional regulator